MADEGVTDKKKPCKAAGQNIISERKTMKVNADKYKGMAVLKLLTRCKIAQGFVVKWMLHGSVVLGAVCVNDVDVNV